ncbi:MAG: discoidin domain-containing protein [Croceibacterium sp.]
MALCTRLLTCCILLAFAGVLFAGAPARNPAEERIVLRMAAAQAKPFRPNEALGAAIDGTDRGGVDRILTRHNVAAMKRAGLRSLTYRLRTELGIEAWHWNPRGSWSDPAHRQGYWTSSAALGKPINLSWGYRLPRRGDTVDQANDQGYSRLTDGDRSTFWKSNPYLDPKSVHDGVAHPQWLVVRFPKTERIDAAVIDWGTPFATRYEVQYWTGANEDDGDGRWVTFPSGRITGGRGRRVEWRLAKRDIATTHVRVLLEAGSGTGTAGSKDWRDRAGYAVREVAFGLRRADGSFADAVTHAPSHTKQTFTHVSSTDPWHRAGDRDPDLEQPGIDRIFASGLTFGQPVMLATGLLYDTPANIRSELRYLARRHYRVGRVELGEEPDGQYASAADYGALYLNVFDRVNGILPRAQIGGPSLQSAFTDTWMQPGAPHAWDGWLVQYLRQRRRLGAVQFVSFEFYPFDNTCGDVSSKLMRQSVLLANAWSRLSADGWPSQASRIISEYGFSAFSGRVESEIPGALLTADIVGQWLTIGGSAAYMFGYPPARPANQHLKCAGYGNMMTFLADRRGQATQPMPSFFAARLLTHAWTQTGSARHGVIGATVQGTNNGDVVVYALRRPDGRISLLLVNRSATRMHRFSLHTRLRPGRDVSLSGPATIWTYGPQQFSWADAGEQSHPARDRPPVARRLGAGALTLQAPPLTMTVVLLSRS